MRDLPIAVRLEGMTIGDLFGNVNEQMKSCAEHSYYPYTLTLDDDLCAPCIKEDFMKLMNT